MYKNEINRGLKQALIFQIFGISLILGGVIFAKADIGMMTVGAVMGSMASGYAYAMVRVADWEKNTK